MLKKTLCGGLLLVGSWISAQTAQAQTIWGNEAANYFRPGAYTPYDGMSIPQRYGYGFDSGPSFVYLGGSGRQLNYLDYADKLERAYKFGYCPPPDPWRNSAPAQPATTPASSAGGLFGFGFFSRRW